MDATFATAKKGASQWALTSSEGDLSVRLDSGREVRFNIREHAHFDHGYAVTSHTRMICDNGDLGPEHLRTPTYLLEDD